MARFFEGEAVRGLTVCSCCCAMFFKGVIPAIAGRFISGDEAHGTRQRTRYPSNAGAFAVMPHARHKQIVISSKHGSAGGEAAAYGETRTAVIKKKLMQKEFLMEAAAPANADQQSSKRARAKINMARRFKNRSLPTESLLNLIRREAPEFWRLAEVVGRWVWIQFDDRQPSRITTALSELGFHWNKRRKAWQHPCGTLAASSTKDPRRTYRSYFPADISPI